MIDYKEIDYWVEVYMESRIIWIPYVMRSMEDLFRGSGHDNHYDFHIIGVMDVDFYMDDDDMPFRPTDIFDHRIIDVKCVAVDVSESSGVNMNDTVEFAQKLANRFNTGEYDPKEWDSFIPEREYREIIDSDGIYDITKLKPEFTLD